MKDKHNTLTRTDRRVLAVLMSGLGPLPPYAVARLAGQGSGGVVRSLGKLVHLAWARRETLESGRAGYTMTRYGTEHATAVLSRYAVR